MRSRPSTRDTSLEGYHNPVGEDQKTQPNLGGRKTEVLGEKPPHFSGQLEKPRRTIIYRAESRRDGPKFVYSMVFLIKSIGGWYPLNKRGLEKAEGARNTMAKINKQQRAQRATYRAPEYNLPLFWQIGQGDHLVFPIRSKNKNLVEYVEILLPLQFLLIPFSGFRWEFENVSANQRPGGHLVFLIGPKNTHLVENVEILLPVKFR